MITTKIEPITAPTIAIISSVAVMIFGNENKENSRRVYTCFVNVTTGASVS